MKIGITVKMAVALLETGDAIALYSGDKEVGMAIVIEPMEYAARDNHVIGTTEGRYWLNPTDEAVVKAYWAFRELGTQGARKMTWSAILEPTPLMLDEVQRGLPRAARAYLIRLRSEDGFAADPKRRKAIEAVLWHFGRLEVRPQGLRPGSFKQRLIEALEMADDENLARLAIGFPDETLAFYIGKSTEDGCEDLKTTLRVADTMAEVNRLAQGGRTYVTDAGNEIHQSELAGHEACPSMDPHGEHVWLLNGVSYLCQGARYEQE